MASGPSADAVPTVMAVPAIRPRPGLAVRFLRRHPVGTAAAAFIAAMVLAATFAPTVAPYDPLTTDYGGMFRPPGRDHWFGSDAFGRDVFSRILYGARTALLVGFGASVVGATAGAVIGMASAHFGGIVDLVTQRLVDVLLSFPLIVVAMAIVAVIGVGTDKLVLAIALSFLPRAARVVRSSALAVRETVYLEAARAMGCSHARIIFRHMAPNVMAPYLVMLTSFLGQAILLEASLSFLGLGVSEPTPAWGLMLRGAAVDFLQRAPWMAVFPGLAISAAVLAFNVFGDALRDALDPKLRV
ncbi:MAG: ABC transporter permease [Armatimonadota bacterium]|nr:ABC transporter permease [Armatimonadota bacterium]